MSPLPSGPPVGSFLWKGTREPVLQVEGGCTRFVGLKGVGADERPDLFNLSLLHIRSGLVFIFYHHKEYNREDMKVTIE